MVKHFLTQYDLTTEVLLQEMEITPFFLEKFRRAFSLEENDPMIECFPIEIRQKPLVESVLGEQIDLSKYALFIEGQNVKE